MIAVTEVTPHSLFVSVPLLLPAAGEDAGRHAAVFSGGATAGSGQRRRAFPKPSAGPAHHSTQRADRNGVSDRQRQPAPVDERGRAGAVCAGHCSGTGTLLPGRGFGPQRPVGEGPCLIPIPSHSRRATKSSGPKLCPELARNRHAAHDLHWAVPTDGGTVSQLAKAVRSECPECTVRL